MKKQRDFDFKILEIKGIFYHRNEVAGRPFYLVPFIYEENGEIEYLIATFETNKRDTKIVYDSCRIINPFSPDLTYRGDVFSEALTQILEEKLKEEKVKHYFDLYRQWNWSEK